MQNSVCFEPISVKQEQSASGGVGAPSVVGATVGGVVGYYGGRFAVYTGVSVSNYISGNGYGLLVDDVLQRHMVDFGGVAGGAFGAASVSNA
jgi:hypothetical protein